MIEFLITTALAAFFNRLRGGGFPSSHLPGHSRLWASGGFFILSLSILELREALTFALCYFVWSTLPVNRWDSNGRTPQELPESEFEAFIDTISFPIQSRFTPLYFRELIGILPLSIIMTYNLSDWRILSISLLYPPLAVASTEVAHYIYPVRFRAASDLLIGIIWGCILLILE